jgi:hypothetical protein
MASLYASMVINGAEGWGDSVPVLWIVEDLWNKGHYTRIDVWDGGSRELCRYHLRAKYYHRDEIIKPTYVSAFLDGPPDERRYDRVLSTGFHAPFPSSYELQWAVPPFPDPKYGGILPPALYLQGPPDSEKMLYLDLNSTVHRLLRFENFAPTLPQLRSPLRVLEQNGRDSLICIQFRRNDPWDGDLLRDAAFDDWRVQLLESICSMSCCNVHVISDFPALLSDSLSNETQKGHLLDSSGLSLWSKMALARRASCCLCSHSGFGLMLSGYVGWSRNFVVNVKTPTVRMPPLQCFANGDELLSSGESLISVDIVRIVKFISSKLTR